VIDASFEAIGIADLQRLVETGRAEGRTLEYKEQLPTGSDADKREFLADVSSLANAAGGDLIYGIREARDDAARATGVPASLDGVALENWDAVQRQLESMIRDGITPRIPGVRLKSVPGFPKGPAIVIRVPQSWAAGPHMVAFQHGSKFFSRNQGGKYQLDVVELRAAFVGSEAIPQRIRSFRDDRLSRIIARETPVPLGVNSAFVCVHVVPMLALSGAGRVDLAKARLRRDELQPLHAEGGTVRFNIDGLVSYARDEDAPYTYLQLFRNGVVETVETALISRNRDETTIPTTAFPVAVFTLAKQLLALYAAIDVPGPYSFMITLIGVKGVLLSSSTDVRIPPIVISPSTPS
jgi:hypothetical protein